jgi:hypothetical protein
MSVYHDHYKMNIWVQQIGFWLKQGQKNNNHTVILNICKKMDNTDFIESQIFKVSDTVNLFYFFRKFWLQALRKKNPDSWNRDGIVNWRILT